MAGRIKLQIHAYADLLQAELQTTSETRVIKKPCHEIDAHANQMNLRWRQDSLAAKSKEMKLIKRKETDLLLWFKETQHQTANLIINFLSSINMSFFQVKLSFCGLSIPLTNRVQGPYWKLLSAIYGPSAKY